MDVGLMWLPLCVMAAAGLTVAAWGFGGAASSGVAFPSPSTLRLRPLVWAAVAAVSVLLVQVFLAGPHIGAEALARLTGGGLLVAAGALTGRANRLRRSAELASAKEPLALDAAVQRARETGRPVQGLFRGRIGSDEVVTSPSGVVCAFYDSELRAGRASVRGERSGPLLSTERGFGQTLLLKGERVTAEVAFHPSHLRAPEEIRRCTVFERISPGLRESLAEGAGIPSEVTAYERIGRLGDACLVAGELRPGSTAGTWEIRGAGSGPAPVVVGHDATVLGRSALRRAMACFAVAVSLCIGAAWLLARTLG